MRICIYTKQLAGSRSSNRIIGWWRFLFSLCYTRGSTRTYCVIVEALRERHFSAESALSLVSIYTRESKRNSSSLASIFSSCAYVYVCRYIDWPRESGFTHSRALYVSSCANGVSREGKSGGFGDSCIILSLIWWTYEAFVICLLMWNNRFVERWWFIRCIL